jgi:hypothetical protein
MRLARFGISLQTAASVQPPIFTPAVNLQTSNFPLRSVTLFGVKTTQGICYVEYPETRYIRKKAR